MWTSSVDPSPTTALPFPFLCPYLCPPFPPAHACAPHAPACTSPPSSPPFPPACSPLPPPFSPAHAGALLCLPPLLSLLCTPPFSPSHVHMSPSSTVPMS